MRLHIGGIRTKQSLNAVNSQLLGHVHVLAATVIAFARVTLGIFVGQLGALRCHHSRGGIVFAGNQLNMVFLAGVFGLNGGKQFGVGLFNQDLA